MHTLCLTTSRVASLQSLSGGGRLYVTPSLTQQQQEQLVGALQALYAQDTQQMQPSTPETLPGPAASAASVAAAAAVAEAAPGRGTEPAAKRPRVEQQEQEQEQEQQQEQQHILNIIVKDLLGSEVHFKVRPTTCVRKVCEAYCKAKSVEFDNCRFIFDGQRLWNPHVTVQDLEMEDGEVIDCFVKQEGC